MFNTEDFKKSVLDRAMRGKLTKQLPEDGDAKDLLNQIDAEKKALIKDKKIKAQKQLTEISADEIPFEIPDNWQWVRLGYVTSINTGLSYKKASLSNNVTDLRIIRGGNISNNFKLILKDDDYRINNDFIKNNNVILKEKQLLTPVSTSPKHTGKVAIVPKLDKKIVAGGFIYQITPIISTTNFSKFLMYALSCPKVKEKIFSITNLSGSALYNIPKTKFINILIPLPPIQEQKRIVENIDKCFDLAEHIDQEDSLTDKFNVDMHKSLLQSAMMGKLTKQFPEDGDASELLEQIKAEKKSLVKAKKIKTQKALPEIDADEIPFEIPDNWRWVRLGEVATINSGHNLNKHISDKGKYLYSKVSDMNTPGNERNIINTINKIDINDYAIPKNSIVFPKIGGAIKTNKRRMIINNETSIDPNTMALTPIYDSITEYLWIYMISLDLSKIQAGTSMPSINKTKVSKLIVPIPPLSEQKRIVNQLDKLFEELKG